VIGDAALFSDGGKRSASCIAVTPSEVYKISRTVLLGVLSAEQLDLMKGLARAKVAVTQMATKVTCRKEAIPQI